MFVVGAVSLAVVAWVCGVLAVGVLVVDGKHHLTTSFTTLPKTLLCSLKRIFFNITHSFLPESIYERRANAGRLCRKSKEFMSHDLNSLTLVGTFCSESRKLGFLH